MKVLITNAHVQAVDIAPLFIRAVLHGDGRGNLDTGGINVGNIKRGRGPEKKRELGKLFDCTS